MSSVNNILVTGGDGFIGKHLVKKLQDSGYTVFNLDIRSGHDLTKYETFETISTPIDVIYHLAAQPYGRGSEDDPYLDLELNTKISLNVNLFAARNNVKKVIYTSTMAVYGNNTYCKEEDSPKPLSNYGVSKLFGEYSLKKFHYNTNIDYTIYRVWNTYGPGQDLTNGSKGLVQAMCNQACNTTNIKVTGSLDRYRDLIYIDDVIDALLLGLNNITNNNTFNISTGIKLTIQQLIDSIIKILNTDKNYTITNTGSHDGDQHGCVGSSLKLQNLGWTPKISLDTGLKKFIEYINEETIDE